MIHSIQILTNVLNMVTVTVFFTKTLGNLKKKRIIFYFVMLIIAELFLFLSNIFLTRHNHLSFFLIEIILNVLSLLMAIFLSTNFSADTPRRLLFSCMYQMLALLGQLTFFLLVYMVNPAFLYKSNSDIAEPLMNCGSKYIFFIYCIIFFLVFRSRTTVFSPLYELLLCITPVISVIICLLIPFRKYNFSESVFIIKPVFVGSLILNILNFILIYRTHDYLMLRKHNLEMECQLDFQKLKYDQLSESYKKSRRILHDARKRYFMIEKYAEEKDIAQLLSYLRSAIKDLEESYSAYNTGNLVIDSMLTSAKVSADSAHFDFKASLNVLPSRIPINDYDLSTILGNLLDNAVTACMKEKSGEMYISIITDENFFRIHESNTSHEEYMPLKKAYIEHGYGLANIKRTSEKNHGSVYYSLNNRIFTIDIAIPCINKYNQRVINTNNTERKA